MAIACAKDEEGRAHVLADHSVTARSPEGWSRAVAEAAALWSAAGTVARNCPHSCPVRVVAEKNQGGFMVHAVLHTADPDLNVRLVTATVSKSERAEPVAMLFEAGKVVLHGEFSKGDRGHKGVCPLFAPDIAASQDRNWFFDLHSNIKMRINKTSDE